MPTINAILANSKLLIQYNNEINERKIMKLKIYLNSLGDIQIDNQEDAFSISFISNDNNIKNIIIKKVVDFLNNTFNDEFSYDEEIKKIYNNEKQTQEQFINRKEEITKYKKENLDSFEEYKNFKLFCDSNLKITLRPYQYEAAFYLSINNGGFDFSVPGAGKTIITYSAYDYFRKNNEVDCLLVIGPLSAYHAWYDEYETVFGVKPNFINLSSMNKDEISIYLKSSSKNHNEINFINIDKTWRMEKEILDFVSNKKILLVIDEAHKEKNPDASITKSVLNISKMIKYKILLTGTPMPNGYEDLFTLMNIYSPYKKILPYNYKQLANFTKKGANEKEEKSIMDSIKPYYSRVSKKYLIETKELNIPNLHYVDCEMSTEQQNVYNYLNGLAKELKTNWSASDIDVSLAKAILIRKMQASANPTLLLKSIVSSMDELKKEYNDDYLVEDSDSDKLISADKQIKDRMLEDGIIKLIKEYNTSSSTTPKNNDAINLAMKIVSENKKVIIWETFVQNMYELKKELQKIYKGNIELINGSVVGEERETAIDNFKNKESMILIANPSTLAESISLHKTCQNAIYVNRNYNAAQFIQSKDRIHRINMPKGTTANYYFLINRNSVDEEVNKKLKLKEERMLRILDSDGLVFSGSDFENSSFMSEQDILDSYDK